VANVIRRDDEKVLPLQAADLLAWQIRRFLCGNNELRRPHFDAAQNCPPETPHTFIMDRQKLRVAFDQLTKESTEIFFAKVEAEYGPQAVEDVIEKLKQLRSEKT